MSSITIGEACQTGVRALPILSYSLYCATTIDAAILTPLKGEAWRKKKIHKFSVLVLQMRPTLPVSKGSSASQIGSAADSM